MPIYEKDKEYLYALNLISVNTGKHPRIVDIAEKLNWDKKVFDDVTSRLYQGYFMIDVSTNAHLPLQQQLVELTPKGKDVICKMNLHK